MEVQKIRQIKNKTKLIEQLFGRLEKLKKHEFEDMTPFKGGLPALPRIVGLIGKLPNGVNNLISGFIGFQSKVAKEIEEMYKKLLMHDKMTRIKLGPSYIFYNSPLYSRDNFVDYLKSKPKSRFDYFLLKAFDKLKKVKSIIQRRSEFTKLQPWLRKFLIERFHYSLFPYNAKNMNFITAMYYT